MKNWVQFVTPLKNITEGDKAYKTYSVLLNVATAQFYCEILIIQFNKKLNKI